MTTRATSAPFEMSLHETLTSAAVFLMVVSRVPVGVTLVTFDSLIQPRSSLSFGEPVVVSDQVVDVGVLFAVEVVLVLCGKEVAAPACAKDWNCCWNIAGCCMNWGSNMGAGVRTGREWGWPGWKGTYKAVENDVTKRQRPAFYRMEHMVLLEIEKTFKTYLTGEVILAEHHVEENKGVCEGE